MMTDPKTMSRRWPALLALLAAAGTALAAEPPPGSLAQVEMLQNTLAAIAEDVCPAVVAIRATRTIDLENRRGEPFAPDDADGHAARSRPSRAEQMKYPAVGSGVVIREDGIILTNEHVVLNAECADILCTLASGETYHAEDVMSDPRRDLAVIRIAATGLKAARLGDLSTVRQGHFVIVMGNPFGSASEGDGRPAMSFGIVSALGRQITRQIDPLDRKYYGNLIQTDARVNPGNSGGPLLNIRGEVIGITTAIATRSGSSQGVGYAIPICQHTRDIIAQLIRGEEVDYGFLGVRSHSATEDECPAAARGRVQGGALIDAVEAGSPAAAAGLQAGDLIVAVAGQPVTDSEELIQEIGAARIGAPVSLTLYRGSSRLSVDVVPARREIPLPKTFSWRGMTLAHADWEVCSTFKLPPDVKGLVVTEVKPGSPADRAGLKVGQVVIQVTDARLPFIRRLPGITRDLTGPVRIVVAGNPPVDLTVP